MLCLSLGSREFDSKDKKRKYVVTTFLYRSRWGRWSLKDVFDIDIKAGYVCDVNFSPDGDVTNCETTDETMLDFLVGE